MEQEEVCSVIRASLEVSLIQQLWSDSDQAQQLSDSKMREALERTRRLSQDIRAGKVSTASVLMDFVLVACDSVNAQLFLNLRQLESEMPQYVGQLVLAVSARTESVFGRTKFFMPTFYLGLLTAEEFVVSEDKVRCEFPTGGKHAVRQTLSSASSHKALEDRNLGLGNAVDFRLLGLPLDEDKNDSITCWPSFVSKDLQLINPPPVKKLEIILGNQEVKHWFEGRMGDDQIIKELTKLIGAEALVATE